MASEISSDDFRGVLDRLIARERPLNRAEVAHWQSTGDYLSKYRGDEDVRLGGVAALLESAAWYADDGQSNRALLTLVVAKRLLRGCGADAWLREPSRALLVAALERVAPRHEVAAHERPLTAPAAVALIEALGAYLARLRAEGAEGVAELRRAAAAAGPS